MKFNATKYLPSLEWAWRLVVVISLLAIFIQEMTIDNHLTEVYSSLNATSENIYSKLDNIEPMPVIPDESRTEIVTCPQANSFYDDPTKYAQFIEIVGPSLEKYPHMIQWTIAIELARNIQGLTPEQIEQLKVFLPFPEG